jgi:hypothetical protein
VVGFYHRKLLEKVLDVAFGVGATFCTGFGVPAHSLADGRFSTLVAYIVFWKGQLTELWRLNSDHIKFKSPTIKIHISVYVEIVAC